MTGESGAAVGAPAFKDHFSARSADYAARRPTYPPALADWLAGIAPRTGLAWDAGCGSGQLSVLLGERFDRVVATDASARQIANARPHPHVDYRCAPAEASGLEDRSADLIVAAQAAHWFDLEGFYAEVRRVARPGAAVALVCYTLPRIEPAVDAALRRFHDERMAPYWPAEREHVDAGYATLPFPFPEIPAPDTAMTADWTLADMLGFLDTWSSVRRFEQAEGRSPIPEFRAALEPIWPEGRRLAVRWPLSVRAGRVGDAA
jgi:SAM-dependent methyltransferase